MYFVFNIISPCSFEESIWQTQPCGSPAVFKRLRDAEVVWEPFLG